LDSDEMNDKQKPLQTFLQAKSFTKKNLKEKTLSLFFAPASLSLLKQFCSRRKRKVF